MVAGFADMLSQRMNAGDTERWSRKLAEMIQRESDAFPPTNEVLGETMTDESLDPYYIWQNRN